MLDAAGTGPEEMTRLGVHGVFGASAGHVESQKSGGRRYRALCGRGAAWLTLMGEWGNAEAATPCQSVLLAFGDGAELGATLAKIVRGAH